MKLHFRPKSDDIELSNEFKKDDTDICNLWYTWNTKFICLAHFEIWWHDAKFVNKIQDVSKLTIISLKYFLDWVNVFPKYGEAVVRLQTILEPKKLAKQNVHQSKIK